MSKKIKDQEVLLVKDQKDDSLRAVVGADGKSGLKLHSFKVSFESVVASVHVYQETITHYQYKEKLHANEIYHTPCNFGANS